MQTRRLIVTLCGALALALLALAPAPARAGFAPSITASSTYSQLYSPERVLDGDRATSWSTFKMGDYAAWLQFDFGRSAAVTSFTLDWGEHYAAAYEVLLSPDGKKWDKIYEQPRCRGGRETLTGLKGKGNLLRLRFLRSSSPMDLVSLREVTFPPDLTGMIKAFYAKRLQAYAAELEANRTALAPRLEALGAAQIVFAARQVVREHWYANIGYYASKFEYPDFRTQTLYRDGGKLYRLDVKSGKLATLLADPRGGVRDPQVSYDGRRILFSYRKGGSPYYHLYEINADGAGLRQLTDGPFDDFEPSYLPDGGIAFVSTRCERWVNCWMTQVAIIYRCDGDGKNIRPLSANTEQDNTPWPLPDGRILYTRWEYVDRSQVHYHHLWTMNPDGTGQAVYFGNQTSGTVMIDAKPVPGTDKVIASFSPGHGREEHKGPVTIVTPKRGPDVNESAFKINGNNDTHDPWALSEDLFLAALKDTIVAADPKGELKEIVRLPEEDLRAGLELHEPRPLAPRPRERVIPARVDLTTATGRMLLANVYEGRAMAGVKRGEIKRLLVLESLPKPINYTGGMEPLTLGGSFTLERVLGTVPVEPDGSAYFEAPPLRCLIFVALDEKGLSVKRMQSFATVEPGETLGCVGCHESRVSTARPQAAAPLAARRAPSKIEPARGLPDVFDFPRDIQPILDRHCVQCHGPNERICLTGDRGPMYSLSYVTLTALRQVADGRNQPKSNYPPRALGSSASPLMKKLTPAHHGVRVTPRERDLVRLWIEAGAPYPGTYAALGSGMLGFAEHNRHVSSLDGLPGTRDAWQVNARRCAQCHKGEWALPRTADNDPPPPVDEKIKDPKLAKKGLRFSRNNLFNLTRPELSRMLRGPLAREAGGLGRCRELDAEGRVTTRTAVVFKSTADPDYQKLLGSVREAKAQLDRITRFDMPNFKPRPEWVREMKRYGVLPESAQPEGGIDVYAAERKYWEKLWWRPAARPEIRTP